MPIYFFDTHDGEFHRDDEGSEHADLEDARREVMNFLPEVARWRIPEGEDHRAFTVLVRDEGGAIVYRATLTFSGLRLNSGAPQSQPSAFFGLATISFAHTGDLAAATERPDACRVVVR